MEKSISRFTRVGCKKFTALERATVAFMVAVCCTLPATAGNKAQVSTSNVGKVEANISYPGIPLQEAKQPSPLGVLSTTSVTNPAAGVFNVRPTGFPTTGNVTALTLPVGAPSTNYCTVTTQPVPGGYRAVMRANLITGAVADNDELELKIPIIPAPCAAYDTASDIIQLTGTTGELRLTGTGTAGTAIWLRAVLYTGTLESPPRDVLIANSILRGELVVAGPFSYIDCPARVPIQGDMTKIYLLVDTIGKSEPYTMTCQNPVSVSCSDANPQYPAPTLTGGCVTDGEAIVRYSIAAKDLPVGVPTLVTATAKALLGNGSVDENSVLATCTFTATRSGLVFDGFYSPLNYQTPGFCSYTFKPSQISQRGQKIPIKFKTLCGGTSVGGTPPTYKITSCSDGSFLQVGTFEFVSGEWHGQFDTTQIGTVAGVYIIEVFLQDGITSKKIAVKLK